MTKKYPLLPLWQFPQQVQHPYLQISMTLFVVLECVQVEEGFATRGTHQPTPKCTLWTCAQVVAHEVDGPSFQPSTQHWYTHLIPPNWMQRGCIFVGRVSFEAGRAAGETVSDACSGMSAVGPENLGPVDSREGRLETVVDGIQWAFFGERWGWRYGGVLPPLSSGLFQASSPSPVLQPLTYGPPPSWHSPF